MPESLALVAAHRWRNVRSHIAVVRCDLHLLRYNITLKMENKSAGIDALLSNLSGDAPNLRDASLPQIPQQFSIAIQNEVTMENNSTDLIQRFVLCDLNGDFAELRAFQQRFGLLPANGMQQELPVPELGNPVKITKFPLDFLSENDGFDELQIIPVCPGSYQVAR